MPAGDFFINEKKINSDRVSVILESSEVEQRFNIADYFIPGASRGVTFPVSMGNDRIALKISLATKGNGWEALKAAEKEIYEEFKRQIDEKIPIRLRHTQTEFYQDKQDVFVLVENPSYSKVGTNGRNLIELEFDCFLHGVSTLDGGDIDPADPWTTGATPPANVQDGIGSQQIGSFVIGSA